MRTRVAAGMAAALLLALPAAAADSIPAPTPGPTSTMVPGVNALVVAGNRVYAGGAFHAVGRSTGGLLAIARRSGATRPFPRLSGGTAADIVPDGRGGWFLGGDFAYVDGFACPALAHVRRNGRLDRSWCPKPDARVDDLTRSGDRLYALGVFRRIRGQKRPGLALINGRNGRLFAWRPRFKVTRPILDTAARGSTLYLAGSFKKQGGVTRAGAAAIDGRGHLARWNPRLDFAPGCTVSGSSPDRCDPVVSAVAVSGHTLYMTGVFERAGGAKRIGRAAVDLSRGHVRAWRADLSETPERTSGPEASLLVAHRHLYEAPALKAFSLATGRRLQWRPRLPRGEASPEVLPRLAATPTGVVIAYVPNDGEAEFSVAAEVDATTGRRLRWRRQDLCCTPPAALSAAGGIAVLGGWFGVSDVQGRAGLAVMDGKTGRFLPWRPRVDGEVRALAVADSTLFVGGEFTSVNGHPRANLAAFDTRTGSLLPWAPAAGNDPRAAIETIAATDDAVFVGGTFEALSGVARHDLGALDPRTGAVLGWNPGPDTEVEPGITALVAAGETVYVGGLFHRIGGATRHSLAALDRTTGLATSWAPDPGRPGGVGSVCGLAVGPSTVYAGGTFDSVAGDARHRGLVALDRSTGAPTGFDAKPDVMSTGALCERDRDWIALELRGSTLFAGLRAFDAETGRELPWKPLAGPSRDADAFVIDLASDGQHLYAGGDLWLSGRTGFAVFQWTNP